MARKRRTPYLQYKTSVSVVPVTRRVSMVPEFQYGVVFLRDKASVSTDLGFCTPGQGRRKQFLTGPATTRFVIIVYVELALT